MEKIAICTGKDCRKHKKMQKKLGALFPEAEEVSCLKICKSPVVIVRGVIITKLRKKKHLDWLLESLRSGEWHPKLFKHMMTKKKKEILYLESSTPQEGE